MTRGCLGFLFPTRSDPALEVASEPDFRIELFELRRALQLNPDDAARYVGAVVETWGRVREVDDGRVEVWPEAAAEGWPTAAAAFVATDSLVPGAPIRLRGVCRGLGPDEVVLLRPCVVVEDQPGAGDLHHRRQAGHAVRLDEEVWVIGGWDPQQSAPCLEVEIVAADGTVASGPALPGARRPAAVVATPSVVVAVGGIERPGQNVDRVDILAARAWVDGPPLPHAWEDGGAAVCRDGVLIAGGIAAGSLFGPPDWRRETWFLGPGSVAWEPRARLPDPRRSGQLLPLADGRLVWIGGTGPEGEVHKALLYDPDGDRWSLVAITPERVGARGLAVLPDGRVLLAGGHATTAGRHPTGGIVEPDTHVPVASCALWDPATGEVVALPDLSVARRSPAVVVLSDGSALVLGGSVATDDPQVLASSDAVDRVDPQAGTVQPQAPLATPRSGAHAVLLGGDVWLIGGEGPGHEVLRSVERRQPTS